MEDNQKPLWVVTGAGGFLGNNLVRTLLKEDQDVRATFLEEEVPASLMGLPVEMVHMDVRDLDSVKAAFTTEEDRPVWVVHAAGIVTIATKVTSKLREVNVAGVENVLTACRETGVQKLVYVSSVHALRIEDGKVMEHDEPEYFDPEELEGAYAKTKAEATALVLAATDLWRVVVLPSGMIGPNDYGDGHMTRLVRDVKAGILPISVDGGYDFVDVRDVSAGVIAAAERGQDGRTYLLSGTYVPASKIVDAIALAEGKSRRVKLPLGLAAAIAPLAERISAKRGSTPVVTEYSVKVLKEPGKFDSRRAKKELGYNPRPFQDSLQDTYQWVESRYVEQQRH